MGIQEGRETEDLGDGTWGNSIGTSAESYREAEGKFEKRGKSQSLKKRKKTKSESESEEKLEKVKEEK
jgi:hypothetical protein